MDCYFLEEALQMAKDFAALSEKAFPVRQIAEFICNRMTWQDDPRECSLFIEHIRFKGQCILFKEENGRNCSLHTSALFRLLIKELSDIINGEHSGIVFGNQPSPNALTVSAIQHGLAHFSLVIIFFIPFKFIDRRII